MTSDESIQPAGVPPNAADEVRAAHARWWNALLDEDVVVLDTLLADDLTFHGPSGGTMTKAAYLDRLRSGGSRTTLSRPRSRWSGCTGRPRS